MLNKGFSWRLYLSEFVGTGLLIFLGLNLVIFMFGAGSIMGELIPSVKVRQAITGFLFGSIGAGIALSPVGRESGAHINPVVTMAFWLFKKIDHHTALWYVIAQMLGGIAGALPLVWWGERGESISFGATLPGAGFPITTVLLGEIITTFTMVSLLIIFLGFRETRRYTPAIFPILYCIMVPLEADISGTSTNPARSLGPALVSGAWQGWWIYYAGPFIGALLASLACSFMAKRIGVAKIYHFDSDRDGLFRKMDKSKDDPNGNETSGV